jgi:uncharacterized membrane protein YqjE
MMAESELEHEVNDGPASNFLRAGRSLAGSLIALLQTRIELISTEIEEEWLRIAALVMIGLAALFCAGMAIILLVALVVAAFWDSHRFLAIGLLAGAFFIATLIFWRSLLMRYQAKPRLFAASLDELGKDHALISMGSEAAR